MLTKRFVGICESIPADIGGGSSIEKLVLIKKLSESIDAKLFVEIGVYRGRSFIPLAVDFSERGGYSYGIDPYSRAAARENDLPAEIAEVVSDFIETADYEGFYQEVLWRQSENKLLKSTNFIRSTSSEAVKTLIHNSVKIDLLHIDGNHDTDRVLEDLNRYMPLLSDNSILVLDDTNWPSVQPAFEVANYSLYLLHKADTYAIFCKESNKDVLIKTINNLESQESLVKKLDQPLVSVSIITYNQEKYIRQCIQSVIDQQINFEMEIVVTDDCSSDRTFEICEELKNKHPNLIRLYKNNKNIGAVRNYIRNYGKCYGEYVAFLEGDDFWLTNIKLQRQVDFLEECPEYAICCHNVYTADGDGALGSLLLGPIKETTSARDLCKGDYIATASCVVRNFRMSLPAWMENLPGCDWAVDIFHAEQGKIKFFPEAMAAYRIHGESMWSSVPLMEQFATSIEVAAKMDAGFDYRYTAEFQSVIDYCRNRIKSELVRPAGPSTLHSETADLHRMGQHKPPNSGSVSIAQKFSGLRNIIPRGHVRGALKSIRQRTRVKPGGNSQECLEIKLRIR